MEFQRDIVPTYRSKKFVLFLTIHSSFWDEEIKNFIQTTDSSAIKEYLGRINSLNNRDERVRQLKAYIFDILKGYFCNYEFTPEFLPVILYKGTGKHWLLLFTIVGAHDLGSISRAQFFQNPDSFLSWEFLTVQGTNIAQLPSPTNFSESTCSPLPVRHFKDSASYKELWVKS